MKQEMMGWQWHQLDHMRHLHLNPDTQPCQHFITQFLTGQMLLWTSNQQCQSTEGKTTFPKLEYLSINSADD